VYVYIYRNKPLSTVCKGPAGNTRKPPSLHDHVLLRQNGPNANLPSRGLRLVEGAISDLPIENLRFNEPNIEKLFLPNQNFGNGDFNQPKIRNYI
jgi:hypothetical protein